MSQSQGNEFVGKQRHILCDTGDVNPYVLIPGDIGRARRIATFFDEGSAVKVAENREYLIYNGTYKGIPVATCSTGIGSPSAAIGVEELGRIGVHTFIRVGSAGGLQYDLNPGDVVIVTAAYRGEGTSQVYIPLNYPAVADLDTTLALKQAAKDLGIATRIGLGSSGDAFYAPKPPGYSEMLCNANVIAGEMECSTVYVVCSLRRWRAGSVVAIDGNIVRKERKPAGTEEAFREGEANAIRIGLEALRLLALQDQQNGGYKPENSVQTFA